MDNLQTALETAYQYQQTGNWQQAEQLYRQILQQQPDNPQILYLLGTIAKQTGRNNLALDYFHQAIRINPDVADFHNNIGETYFSLQLFPQAIASWEKTIQLDSHHLFAHNNLGMVFQEMGNFSQAIIYYEKAIKINPNLAVLYNNLGNCYKEQGKAAIAITMYEKALNINPDIAALHNNLGVALYEEKQLEKALACYRKALSLSPDHVPSHYNLSRLLLQTGHFQEGWQEYEWRWQQKQFPPRNFSQPIWDGSSLAGKTILLHAEQGLGDTIQFIRYVPLVAAFGGKIMVETQAPLVELLQSMSGIEQIIIKGETLPKFDTHAPLLSLPRILGTRLKNIPAQIPYLYPPKYSLTLLAPKETKLKVGIVWASGYHNQINVMQIYKTKSSPLAMFIDLLAIPEITFFSLQIGRDAAALKDYRYQERLYDLSHQIRNFADTASIVSQLDLVITVDTSVTHLAGALGKPVWVLLPFMPDWRWLLDRDDTPWYPTMRLFRQSYPGIWSTVFAKIAEELLGMLSKNKKLATSL